MIVTRISSIQTKIKTFGQVLVPRNLKTANNRMPFIKKQKVENKVTKYKPINKQDAVKIVNQIKIKNITGALIFEFTSVSL